MDEKFRYVIPYTYIDAKTGRRSLLMPIFKCKGDDIEMVIAEKTNRHLNQQTFQSFQ